MDAIDTGSDQREAFRKDVIAGLSNDQKTLPSRWLYDDYGCELFEKITQVEEYYPTRTEAEILSTNAKAIGAFFGPDAVLIEYGAGAGVKTEIVLGALEAPNCYVPVDIAGDFLESAAARLREAFPHIPIRPMTADFTRDFALPADLPQAGRCAFFPGSTIGNLGKGEAEAFLKRVLGHVGPGGKFVIGIDRKKDISNLLAAYDDRAGVTAAFNLNILTRINRDLGGSFDLRCFEHEARWNSEASAVEMHLVCISATRVAVDEHVFNFEGGETIHTESSRKYELKGFEEMGQRAGWSVEIVWTDPKQLFALVGLSAN